MGSATQIINFLYEYILLQFKPMNFCPIHDG